MKIRSIEAIPLEAKADKVITMSQGTFDSFRTTIVRIRTDEGIEGYGECMVRAAAEPTKAIVDKMLAPALIGRDPLDVEAIANDMFRSERHRGHTRGLFIEAMSGIDIALWDIIAKYHQMPLGKLFGGYDRKRVRAYASSVMIDAPEKMAERAQELVSLGYRAIKVKIGTTRTNDVRIMETVRRAVGSGIDLMADANSFYGSVRDALYVGQALGEMGVLWMEEPVMPDNVEGYATLAARLDIALAGGESLFTARDYKDLLHRQCLDVVQPDITRCGGITESRRIAALALAYDREYAPHTGFSSSVCVFATMQLAAWAPNFTVYEYSLFGNPLQRLTENPLPAVTDGCFDIPQGVGIGCTLDEGFLEHYRIDR